MSAGVRTVALARVACLEYRKVHRTTAPMRGCLKPGVAATDEFACGGEWNS